jgi:hypothetical protein
MTNNVVEDDEEDKKDKRALRQAYQWSAVVLLIVLALWIATPFAVTAIVGQQSDQRGQFGDLYGSINSLFSGLAFAGVIIAILLQRRELELQRRELRYARFERRASVAAQDEAQKALNKTIYANSFKVVLDILESPDVVRARGHIYERSDAIRQVDSLDWDVGLKTDAQLVVRTFDSVGTMMRKNLLPADYILDRYSIATFRCWRILERYVQHARTERKDPFLGDDFEALATLAINFVEERSRAN